MFRLFNTRPASYPIAEIEAGQHLKKAKKGAVDTLFEQKITPAYSEYKWLFIDKEHTLYWGKVTDQKVSQSDFYCLPQATLQEDFVGMDVAFGGHCFQKIKAAIISNLQEIDGAKYDLLDVSYQSMNVTTLTTWEFIMDTLLLQSPVSAQPTEPTEEEIPFRVIVNATDFSIVQVRMV